MTDEGRAPVDVVIVSWNTRELLDRCLASLADDARDGLVEVVVVDNASTDGSADMVRKRHAFARLEEPGQNLGFGPAVNHGARQGGGDWVAAANADIEIAPGAISELVEAATQDAAIGAIAPRLVLPDGSVQDSVHTFPRLTTSILAGIGAHAASNRVSNRLFGATPRSGEAHDVDFAMGAFLVMRRTAFESIGGFDASQWMYAEDLDICWRLHRDGWRVVYLPGASVAHVGGAAADQAFGASSGTVEVASAHYAWMRRRRGTAYMLAFATLTVSFLTVRVATYRIATLIGVRGATARLESARAWLRTTVAAVRRARRS